MNNSYPLQKHKKVTAEVNCCLSTRFFPKTGITNVQSGSFGIGYIFEYRIPLKEK